MNLFKKLFGNRAANQQEGLVSSQSPELKPLEPESKPKPMEPQSTVLTEEELKRLDEEMAEKRRLRREEPIRKRLANLTDASQGTAKGLSRLAHRAKRLIEHADSEFKERAYAPFWSAVEEAALALAKCENQSRFLAKNIQEVGRESVKLAELRSDVPPIPSINKLVTIDLVAVAKQLKEVVRLAQKDYEFSTIYEQRRTNRILVEGFSTLGNAIQGLGDRLSQSITRLNKDLSRAITDVAKAQLEAAIIINDTLQTEANDRRSHEGKVEEMLDNIQRKIIPDP